MNIFNLSEEEFNEELKNYEHYLDTLTKEELLAQFMICGMKPKFSIKRFIKQLFCKHEFRKDTYRFMANEEEEYVICRKCGEFHKINGEIPEYIPKYKSKEVKPSIKIKKFTAKISDIKEVDG